MQPIMHLPVSNAGGGGGGGGGWRCVTDVQHIIFLSNCVVN